MSGPEELRALVEERWLSIHGLEGRYDVSDQGRVRSIPRLVDKKSRSGNTFQYPVAGGVLVQKTDRKGYLYVGVRLNGRHLRLYTHQVVLRAFVGPAPARHEVAHGDGDKTNNRLANLRYATRSENHADKSKHGTMPRGASHPRARLTEQDVAEIKASELSQGELATKYGVRQQQISKIKRGLAWASGSERTDV